MADYQNLSECEKRGYDIAVDELDSVIESRVEERLARITEDLEAKILKRRSGMSTTRSFITHEDKNATLSPGRGFFIS